MSAAAATQPLHQPPNANDWHRMAAFQHNPSPASAYAFSRPSAASSTHSPAVSSASDSNQRPADEAQSAPWPTSRSNHFGPDSASGMSSSRSGSLPRPSTATGAASARSSAHQPLPTPYGQPQQQNANSHEAPAGWPNNWSAAGRALNSTAPPSQSGHNHNHNSFGAREQSPGGYASRSSSSHRSQRGMSPLRGARSPPPPPPPLPQQPASSGLAQPQLSPLSPHVEPFSPSSLAKQGGSRLFPPPAGHSDALEFDSSASYGPQPTHPTQHYQPPAFPAHPYPPPHGFPASQAGFDRQFGSLALSDMAPPPGSYGHEASEGMSRKEGSQSRAYASGPASERGANSGGEGPPEEISTIFVVGFPEDMNEREFQNMFIFSVGFEAATLKIPTATAPTQRDKAGPQPGANGMWDPFSGLGADSQAYEDSFGNQPLDNSAQPPQSSALALALASNSREGAASPAGARKQSIGFAKFKTRALALAARDQLSGKKVDPSGATLKAEMAKKNLHTKRSTAQDGQLQSSGAQLDGPALARLAQSGNLNPAMLAELARQSAAAQQQQQSNTSGSAPTSDRDRMFDAFHSVPASAAAPSTSWPGPSRSREATVVPASAVAGRDYLDGNTSPALASANGPYLADRAFSRERAGDIKLSSSPHDGPANELTHPHSPGSTSSSPRMRSMVGGPAFAGMGKLMLQQLDGAAEFEDLQRSLPAGESLLGPTPGGQFQGRFGAFGANEPQFADGPELNQSNFHQFGAQPSRGLTSPPIGPGPGPNGLVAVPRSQNPADAMNTPKNTLYVGGLPAVLPSLTGPFSAAHLEDSLRQAFSRCPGFKRLCFRSKSNGPIVFVEFDDVVQATRAMNEMYGATLGGLVKGGIRLSYSKNPLGVRPGGPNNNSQQQQQQQLNLGHHHNPGPNQFGPAPNQLGPQPHLMHQHPDNFYQQPNAQRRAPPQQLHQEMLPSAGSALGYGGPGPNDFRPSGQGQGLFANSAPAPQAAFSPWQDQF